MNVFHINRKEITELQLEKLNELLKLEKKRGGFYSSLPDSVTSLAQLRSFPFTTEKDLRESGGKMLLVSQGDVQKVITGSTSGTTGEIKRVFYTAADCENTVRFFMRGLGELVYKGGKTIICMPFCGPNGLGELISEAIKRLGAEPIKAGTGISFHNIINIINTEKPDTFVGMPVPLLGILRINGRGSLERALVSGDALPDTVEQDIERILGSKLFPHYGSREMCLGGAITCSAHFGMHLREDHIIAEIIDGDGNVLPEGRTGELVITTIGMQAQPLIRYRTGDYTRILPGKCPCGCETLRIGKVSRHSSIEKADNIMFLDRELIDWRGDKRIYKKDLSETDRPLFSGKRFI